MRNPLRSLRFHREHRWTASHLSEYIDSELGAAERERIEAHVGACPQCHRLLATLRRTVDGLRGLRPGARTDAGIAEGVIERLRHDG